MATTALDHLSLGGKIEWLAQLDTAYQPERNLRRTSIICTIGPKTNSVEAINKLREAGLNVVRMNFSHGSYEYHRTFLPQSVSISEPGGRSGSAHGFLAPPSMARPSRFGGSWRMCRTESLTRAFQSPSSTMPARPRRPRRAARSPLRWTPRDRRSGRATPRAMPISPSRPARS